MNERVILEKTPFDLIIHRLTKELIENYDDFEDSCILGLQPRGVHLARELKERLDRECNMDTSFGLLDITFYRDDFKDRDRPFEPKATEIEFSLDAKKVILVDDVVYTGRSILSALTAMLSFGRPKQVELLTLVDRKYQRDLPISANYIGKKVNTQRGEWVEISWEDRTVSICSERRY